MSLRLRKSLSAVLRPKTHIRITVPLHTRLISPLQSIRHYATPTDLPTSLPQIPADLLSKFQKSPKILEQLQVVIKMFQAKGYATDKAPSMMEMAKMGMDGEFMTEIRKLHGVMEEEGVVGDLMEVLKGLRK